MSNGMNARQNEEESIAKLAAQRQLYNEAKKLGGVSVLFSIILPLLFAFLLLLIEDNPVLMVCSYFVSIISMFVSLTFNKWIADKKKNAAFIQQQFDVYVFQMSWNKHFFGSERNVTAEIVRASEPILRNPSERDKLRDWYTPVVDEMEPNKAILVCQKENFLWDVGLRKRFRWCSSILVFVLIVGIFVLGVIQEETVVMLLGRLAFIVPMLQWLFETIKQLNDDIERLNKLDEVIDGPAEKTMEELQKIQRGIFEHRQCCYTIPNFFYKIFRDNDEDRAHRIANMDRKGNNIKCS